MGMVEVNDLPFSKESQTALSPGQTRYCDESGARLLKKDCKCPRCRGRRSQKKGKRGQKAARRVLGLRPERWSSREHHEESWNAASVRVEVKSGDQANPIATRYVEARAQSDAARAVGDNRPFVFAAVPDGSMPLLVIRGDDLADVVYSLIEEWAE